MADVLTVGEALVAIAPEQRGRLGEASRLRLYVAGAESNVAIGLARLGIAACFVGAVGQDPFGDAIRSRLAGEGVEVDGIAVRPEPTGIFFKEWYGLTQDPRVYYYRSQSAGRLWSVTEADRKKLMKVKWLHSSGITAMLGDAPRTGLRTLVEDGRRLGITISLDINLRLKLAAIDRWRAVVTPLLAEANLVFATEQELAQLYGDLPIEEYFERGWLNAGAYLVMKLGSRGAAVFDRDGVTARAKSFMVTHPVDSVGAGDGFAAGVIAARLKGLSWDEALRLGNLVGALAVNHPGDFDGYPKWAEAQALLSQNWVDR